MRQQWGLRATALTLGVKPDTGFATLQSQAAKEILQSEDLEALADRTLTGAELQGRIASDADAVTRGKAFSK
ncbi:hypothetical protein QM716_01780 [Rhodococcus sp. IEGM 1409]|uniref:hypothetical protein n=1 Tax=Rhodococcus sp. IEGM 1409 TaxID=3047082 RepID=UPI0024B7B4F8|nr:hypothetical protein [Rhodococcus sp. IEGM 1409]MDI9898578.1 hypothetical protein [Rhodococcus sp. IEGM 1409]